MRCHRLLAGLLTGLAASYAMAADSSPKVQSACASCHAAQTAYQPQTPMAHALLPSGENPTLAAHPKLTLRKGAYAYSIETHDRKSTYNVTDGAHTISLPIRWTIGQRMQTWIFEREGRYYQSRISYYPTIDGLEITVGDERLIPKSLDEAVGRELKHAEARDCFGCHSSNAVSKGELTLASMQPGVTCEHCHEGTTTHLWNALQGVLDSPPPSLKKLPAEDVSNFCGQCHRTWETVIRNGIRGEANVRFQPYRLANSRCFDGSDPRISCTACHDPHQNLVRDDSTYDETCQSCHSRASRDPAAAGSEAKLCPVSGSRCTTCHMPKVKVNSPAGFLTFTDHQIRVVRPGDPYPN